MTKIFRDKIFQLSLISFILLNILLYVFIYLFHNLIPLNQTNYLYSTHHYFEDPKVTGGQFNFLRSLGQYDAQWYLKIASDGYAKDPKDIPLDQYRGSWEVLSYAFFPLYPLILSIVNLPFQNIELTAFIISNVLMIINFASLYYVVSKLFNEQIAKRTCFLLFLFPFSLFFRSYFTEGLFLLLLIWFSYFFISRKYIYSALLLGLMTITRPNGLFLIPLFCFFLLKEAKTFFSFLIKSIPLTILIALPLLGWIYLNFYNTNDPFYFYSVQGSWFYNENIFTPLKTNFERLSNFITLPIHQFHVSKIDFLMVFASIFILLKSKKFLKGKLWSIALFLSVIPLLIKDTQSYSRYVSIVFPFFIYLAIKLRNTSYGVILGIFSTLLFITALYFINWYWIG